jgi:putative methionine-R-sulfoxide reductase with GAF domain
MNPWIVLAAIVLLGIVYVMLPTGLYAFARFRRPKLVHCPVTGEEAQVQIDARRAGLGAALSGRASLRVTECALWPEWKACARSCVRAFKGA